MRTEHFYKYRDLKDFKRFMDIIVNHRLYATVYSNLNDPMEGTFLANASSSSVLRHLSTKKNKICICSLSKDYTNTLLWSHYADGHKGCCIEVSPMDNNGMVTMKYDGKIPCVKSNDDYKSILSCKGKYWNYEQEVRFFRKQSYLNVVIHRIYFGMNVTKNDYKFYEKLIKAINPKIDVVKMSAKDIDTGFCL